ncbi:MAG: hypothetical protein J1F64_05285 [Oscillospiraceae bacterium]|nr:hypothetical protein [Oscillospiraceae bacterium]
MKKIVVLKKTAAYSGIIALTVLIILRPDHAMQAAENALLLCGETIIPSLFPFFVCSGLLIYSGFAQTLAKICSPIMKPVFGISGSGSAAFVLGLISGYPLGASTACSLYESGYLTEGETERLLGFCNNSGPLFILGAIGASLFGNPKIGWLIYISHIAAAFAVGIILKFTKKEYEVISPHMTISNPKMSIGEIFSTVISNSVGSMLNVCGVIVFASTAAQLLLGFFPCDMWYTAFITGLFEFASGTGAVAELGIDEFYKIILSAFIVGFAGISVHLQVMSITSKYRLSLKKYILGKLMQAGISAAVVYFVIRYTNILYKFTPAEKGSMSMGFFTAAGFVVFVSAVIAIVAVSVSKARKTRAEL